MFLLASIFSTFATLSIISLPIILAFHFKKYIFQKRAIPVFLILLAGIVISIPYVKQTKFYQTYVHEKLFSNISNVNSGAAYSKADRLVTIQTAVSIIRSNPIFGVGLNNFSRHYGHYYDGSSLDIRLQKKLRKENFKTIPNSIYFEVLTESGFLAFIVYILFLLTLLFYSVRAEGFDTLFPAFLCMLICYIAYPSFIMIYLWCFMALPAVHYIKSKNKNASE